MDIEDKVKKKKKYYIDFFFAKKYKVKLSILLCA